jgi:hypothetical protein
VVAAYVASVVTPAPAMADGQGEPSEERIGPVAPVVDPVALAAAERVKRAEILAESMGPYDAWRYRTGMVVLGSAIIAADALIMDASSDDATGDAILKGSMALAAGSVIAGVVAPSNEAANAVAEVGVVASVGTTLLGAAFVATPDSMSEEHANDHFYEANAILGAGYFGAAAWMAIDHVVSPRPTYGTMMRLRARVRTAAQRSELGEDVLTATQREFLRGRTRKRYVFPPVAAAAAAVIYASTANISPRERDAAYYMGIGQLVGMALVLVTPDPVASYRKRELSRRFGPDEKRVPRRRLDVIPPARGGGAILSVSGSF